MSTPSHPDGVAPNAEPPAATPASDAGLPRAGRIARLTIALLLLAQILRILADDNAQPQLPAYAALIGAYLAVFALVWWGSGLPGWVYHACFAAQSGLILAMLRLNPEVDTVTVFFVPLSFQLALRFTGRAMWRWVAGMALLTGGSLALLRGPLEGPVLALSPMAAMLALPALVLANHHVETERARSQHLLSALETRRRLLEQHAVEVEELAAIEERHRLARSLHDTASQVIFSIALTARSAQMLLERDPGRTRAQLLSLQEMSGTALAQLRSLISQMRP